MAETLWFETFFDETYLQLYRPVVTPQEVEFVASTLGLPAGGSALDLGCGQSHFLLPLAELGYRMIGLDLSPTLLEKTRDDARALSLPKARFQLVKLAE